MECKQIPKDKSYEFFENIEKYIEIANSAESTTDFPNANSGCNSFITTFGYHFKDSTTAKHICVQFIKLYDSLNVIKNKSKSDTNYEKCRKFLIYWINFKLREGMKNEVDSICRVYDAIESQFTGSNDYNIHMGLIGNINKDDLYKMNILYRLYVNYVKLKAIDYKNEEENKRQLLTHSTACCTHYIKASYICNDDNKDKNPEFCEKLEAFVSKYKQLNQKVDDKGSGFSDYFIKLSECPNTKIITTAVTGSIIGLIPLVGVLYKVIELNIKL
ncbi:hypothetical protein PVNG_06262 [Plasmodium vivax North Korean]|uniref:Uncharacterized protein n=1 Tax=Plasmodium vivax North Korean TaxID=1035514 RepID=A0A0J9TN49_PLAVI|nr:hypothetical protein PVNG_06262 [Plasmodium vivax North Korean]